MSLVLKVKTEDVVRLGGDNAILLSFIIHQIECAQRGECITESEVHKGITWVRLPVPIIERVFTCWNKPKIYRMLKLLVASEELNCELLGKNGMKDVAIIKDKWYSINSTAEKGGK